MSHDDFVGLAVFLGFVCSAAFFAAVGFGIACAVNARDEEARAAQYLWQTTTWFMVLSAVAALAVVIVIYTG